MHRIGELNLKHPVAGCQVAPRDANLGLLRFRAGYAAFFVFNEWELRAAKVIEIRELS